jgi:hypothetical protein
MNTSNTKLYLTLNLLTATFLHIRPLPEPQDIIPDSSYCVYEGENEITGGISSACKHVTFYTFDGTAIRTVEHDPLGSEDHMLDLQARKPQPQSCTIKYWNGNSKTKPGWFIIFYDRHKNSLGSYHYDKETHEIRMHCTLDRCYKTFHFNEQSAQPQIINEEFALDLSRMLSIRIEPRAQETPSFKLSDLCLLQ